jgi:hypothetical protein
MRRYTCGDVPGFLCTYRILCNLSPSLSSCHALVLRPYFYVCVLFYLSHPLFVIYLHIYLPVLRSYLCVCVLVCLCIYRSPSFSSISTTIFLSCTRPAVICPCLCTCLFVYLSHPLFVIYLHTYLLVMHSSCGPMSVSVYLSVCVSIAPPLCHLSPHLSSCHALVCRPYVCVCVLVYLCIYRTPSLSSILTSICLS